MATLDNLSGVRHRRQLSISPETGLREALQSLTADQPRTVDETATRIAMSMDKVGQWDGRGRRGTGRGFGWSAGCRDAIFRKIINLNQTDTNEMATAETKYQTDFYSAQTYQH